MSATTQRLAENLQGARKHLADFTGSINVAGAAFAGFAAALASGVAVGAIADIVKAGSELGSVMSAAKVVFADSSGTIIKEAQRLADEFGIVKTELIKGANTIGKFFKAAGKTDAESAALSINLLNRALESADLVGSDRTRAIEAFGKALKGEFDPIEDFVTGLNAAAIASKAVDMGLAKSASTVSDAGKKMATYALILEGSKDAAGQLTRAAAETDNMLKKIAGDAANAKADVGLAFDPAINAVLKLTDAIGNGIGNALEKNKGAITEWATNAAKQGGLITQTFEFIGDSVGLVADGLQYLNIGFKGLQVAATAAGYGVVYILDLVGKSIEGLVNLLPGVKVNFTSTLDAIGKDLGELIAKQADDLAREWNKPLPSTAIKSFFNEIKNGAVAATQATNQSAKALDGAAASGGALTAKINELTAKLREQVATFGMSSTATDIFKLKQAGASDSALAEAKALATQVQGLEDAKKIQDEMQGDAKKLFEETRTPAEKFANEMAKIDSLLKAGLIDPTTASRASEALGKDLAGQAPEKQNAAALQFGSTEARSAVLAFQNKSAGGDSIKDLNKVSKDHFSEATKQTVLLAKIANGGTGQPAILAF